MTNFIKRVTFSISPLSLMPYLRLIIFIEKTAEDEKQAEKQAEDDMYVKTFY